MNSAANETGVELQAKSSPARDEHLLTLAAQAVPADALCDDGVSLYVHLPFCVRKCRYCDFNSYVWTGQSLENHVRAVLDEAQRRAAGSAPQTVFIGGGTPTFLPADLLAELLDGLHNITGFRDSAHEATIEANPESLDDDTAKAAVAGGVSRISIGIQSLRADVLQAYDRVHDAEEALAAFHRARAAGVARINTDLIFAFPGQDFAQWEEDLTTVLALEPEHLSAYELAYEPGTALTRLRDAGRFPPGDPDRGRWLFERTRDLCADHGFGQYEVSNFARPGEACMHNLAYWRSLDYIGIGAGAVSWEGGERRKNHDDPAAYEKALRKGGDAGAEFESPDPTILIFDALMMGLRLPHEGVDLDRLANQAGADPVEVLGAPLQQLIAEGTLELDADQRRLRTTPAGLAFLDSALTRLLPATSV